MLDVLQKTVLSDFSLVCQVTVALTMLGLTARLVMIGAVVSRTGGVDDAIPLNFLAIPKGRKQFEGKSLSPQFLINPGAKRCPKALKQDLSFCSCLSFSRSFLFSLSLA